MIIISAYAFAKLSWFRVNCTDDNVEGKVTKNPNFLEVSLMGVSESDDNLGYITDFICVPQECSGGLTEPDDGGMNTYIESMLLDKEISIIRCARFWAHTHPGKSPTPSQTDNDTFGKWFGHSDIGVMYILAEDDDSCKVKHASKYFGMNVQNMPVFVELDMIDENGNKVLLSTKTLFAINKIGISDGYSNMSSWLYNNYTDKEAEWMAELRANVKKKSYHHPQAGFHYQQQYNHQQPNKNLIPTNTNGTGKATSTIILDKKPSIRVSDIIELLIHADKNSINEFSKSDKIKILNHFDITMGEFQEAYNRLLNMEKTFTFKDLDGDEHLLIDDNGKSRFDEIGKVKMIELCKRFVVRPSHLKAIIDEYIKKANEMPKCYLTN